MRIYYIDESEGPRFYVRSALGVDAERWNDLHGRILDWRTAIEADFHVPRNRELHGCDLLAGRGKLARVGNVDRRLSPEQGAEIFMNGLRIIESAARWPGVVEVVNRINSSVAADGRYAHLIIGEGGERMGREALLQAKEPPSRAHQVRDAGGRRPAPDGRSNRPRPAQAGRRALGKGKGTEPSPGLRDLRRRTQP